MAQQTRTTLKNYFLTGDKPTQSQFADLIDSFLNFAELDFSAWTKATIIYSSLTGLPGSDVLIPAAVLNAKEYITDIIVHVETAFAGPGISNGAIAAKDAAGTDFLSGYASIITTGSNTNTLRPTMAGYFSTNVAASWQSNIYLFISGCTLAQLTAGKVNIYIRTAKITP